MNEVMKTIRTSLQEILASGIKMLPGLLTGIIIIMLTAYAAKFTQSLSNRVGHRTLRSQSLQILFSKTSYVMTWVTGVIFACVVAFPSLRLGDIIATLGLGSVAIGFAFQDIFKNFLAGVLILIQEPFRISDQIIVGDYEGTVTQINIRTTEIATYQGEKILLPNSTVFTSAVQVRTALGKRRTDLALGVDYNTSLSEAREILQQTLQQVNGVLPDPKPDIDIVAFGESSIDLIARYWTLPQQQIVRRTQTRAILAIKEAFDQAKINIPYPIRTLYFYNQDKTLDSLPASNGHSMNLKR
ncbi:mechanosensitive ion channel family protein [Gloeothece verrucosa]|uniref:MscS Mechanosensitive ion channel n=1 Tax=Gloeothece verrucosa (strain PCC 7822) TaxID=497965 RepID=E0U950_GLOV7|nr:mechanosensitive ion channel family protein [Gloeothece verrucosa]ADN17308.1 MscS Mechanosensitive ion channel [Gloeothece verrucosa PCC 7822]